MARTVELKPCPFCGGMTEMDKCHYGGADPDAYCHFVRCVSCAAEGPWGKSESTAVANWNRRCLTQDR